MLNLSIFNGQLELKQLLHELRFHQIPFDLQFSPVKACMAGSLPDMRFRKSLSATLMVAWVFMLPRLHAVQVLSLDDREPVAASRAGDPETGRPHSQRRPYRPEGLGQAGKYSATQAPPGPGRPLPCRTAPRQHVVAKARGGVEKLLGPGKGMMAGHVPLNVLREPVGTVRPSPIIVPGR